MIALVDDKTRVRVCLDTCHTFAAGYDLRTPEAYKETMDEFAKVVGFEYLAGIHLNDSKAPLGGNRDLHENIGLGEIGLTGFRELVRDPRMAGIPMVLETPSGPEDGVVSEIWGKEVALLYEIQGVPDSEWETKKGEIEARWRKERDAISPPKAKPVKKTASKAKGKKKKDESESEAEDSE
jgi:AP endonuclease-1